jgi:hypothetical protein
MKAELAAVYRLGNSPTDAALEQADRSLSADRNEAQFKAALELIEQNIRIRQNSLKQAAVLPDNPYARQSATTVDIFT